MFDGSQIVIVIFRSDVAPTARHFPRLVFIPLCRPFVPNRLANFITERVATGATDFEPDWFSHIWIDGAEQQLHIGARNSLATFAPWTRTRTLDNQFQQPA